MTMLYPGEGIIQEGATIRVNTVYVFNIFSLHENIGG